MKVNFTDTKDLHSYSTIIDGQTFAFIDTPGFSDLDNDSHVTAIKICHWLCDYIFAPENEIYGVLCLQDIGVPKETLAMQCSVEFLQALVGRNDSRNIVFVTTKWDSLNQSKLSRFERRHDDWGTAALWRPLIDDGAISYRHYGITNTTDDDQDDIQRARQSRQDLLSRFLASNSMQLRLREEFGRRGDKGSTANWLVNAMPSLHRFRQREDYNGKTLMRENLSQDNSSESYFTPRNIAAAVGAVLAGGFAYHHKDDIKRGANAMVREARKAHRRLESKTGMDLTILPGGPNGTVGFGIRANIK
jgi:hypothetical protein